MSTKPRSAAVGSREGFEVRVVVVAVRVTSQPTSVSQCVRIMVDQLVGGVVSTVVLLRTCVQMVAVVGLPQSEYAAAVTVVDALSAAATTGLGTRQWSAEAGTAGTRRL
jgi:hypothetical protein